MASVPSPSPLGNIAESVGFILRAINGAGNVLFNRLETLAVPNGNEVGINDAFPTSVVGNSIPLPATVNGVWIFNIDPAAVITLGFTGLGFSGTVVLNPFGAICLFNPNGGTAFTVIASTSIDQSNISYAYWA